MDEREATVEVQLTPAELALLQTALGHLEATLGREEAEELEAVQQLIAMLRRVSNR